MTNYKSINSSNLNSANYNAGMQLLYVKFKNGTKYFYPDFSPELYNQFEETFSGENGKSAGKFFAANIKHLPCEKVS